MAITNANAKTAKKDDGVIRRGDAQKEGVQIGNLFVYRVSETDEDEPGVEKVKGASRAHCGRTGIRGYVANLHVNDTKYKDSKQEQFGMLEIFLTAPAYGVREADGESETAVPRRIEAGGSLLVPLNHQLQALQAYATHPSMTIEVTLIPLGRTIKATAAGNHPRNWEIRLHRAPGSDGLVERSKIEGFASLPMLPPADDRRDQGLPALPA